MGELVESIRATADANGLARAQVQVSRFGERWSITSMTTQTDSANDTELRVYRGAESASGLVVTTYAGNLDTAGGTPLNLRFGESLQAVWSGATPGAQCTLTLQGERFGR